MTVALLAQRHTRLRRSVAGAAFLAVIVFLGGLVLAQSLQNDLAADVRTSIGATTEPVLIEVDGRDVILRTPIPLTVEQISRVSRLDGVASVMVEDGP